MNSLRQSGNSKAKNSSKDSSKAPSITNLLNSKNMEFQQSKSKISEKTPKSVTKLNQSTPATTSKNKLLYSTPKETTTKPASKLTTGFMRIFKSKEEPKEQECNLDKSNECNLDRSKSSLSENNRRNRQNFKRSGSLTRTLQRDRVNIDKNISKDDLSIASSTPDKANLSRSNVLRKPISRKNTLERPKSKSNHVNESTEPVVKSIRTPYNRPKPPDSLQQNQEIPLVTNIEITRDESRLSRKYNPKQLQFPTDNKHNEQFQKINDDLPLTPLSTSSSMESFLDNERKFSPPSVAGSCSGDSGYGPITPSPYIRSILEKNQSTDSHLHKITNATEAHEHLRNLIQQLSITEEIVKEYNTLEYDHARIENEYLDEKLQKKEQEIQKLKETVDRLQFELRAAKAMLFMPQANLVMNDPKPPLYDWDTILTLFETVDKMKKEYSEIPVQPF